MTNERQKKEEWQLFIFVIIGIFATVVFFFKSPTLSGHLIYSEDFVNPQACVFVDDCKGKSAELGQKLTCRLISKQGTTKYCMPPLEQSQLCRGKDDCDVGLTCVKPNDDAQAWLCKKYPRGRNQTCRTSRDCDSTSTCVMLEEAKLFTCQPKNRAQEERCAATSDCNGNLKCIFHIKKYEGLIGECMPARKPGEKCWRERDCVDGYYCRHTRQGGSRCMTGEQFKEMWRS
jgi:hypothetical protein